MMNRLLSRLDDAIAASRLPREVPLLRAERAVVLARLGELDRMRQEVATLRASPEMLTMPVLNAWLLLAEGLGDWLEAVRIDGRPWGKVKPAPALPAEVIEHTAAKYREALERLMG